MNNSKMFYLLDIDSNEWRSKKLGLTDNLVNALLFTHSQVCQILNQGNVGFQALNALNPTRQYDDSDNKANKKVYLHLVKQACVSIGNSINTLDELDAVNAFNKDIPAEEFIESSVGLGSFNRMLFALGGD
jgi:hypothetical protein